MALEAVISPPPPPGTFPYRLARRGVIMRRRPGVRAEAEGVLNPASATAPDGTVWLLPRLVGPGNESRVGLARVAIEDGVPVGTEPPQVVLGPEAHWEMSADHAGVEDPRVTWVPSLGVWVMCYVAFGPTGPRLALAVSRDLRYWQRLGPVRFAYDQAAAVDLGVLDNKDGALFPEPVPGPDGRPSYALLHRPVWDSRPVFRQGRAYTPSWLGDSRPSIWISYAPAEEVQADLSRLATFGHHRVVASPGGEFESSRIGAGTPPLRTPDGWLTFHHGVRIVSGRPRYCAGAMLLDPEDPGRVLARTEVPLLEPEAPEEREGTVPDVVFPTAIERIGDRLFVFYGMADAAIGAAEVLP